MVSMDSNVFDYRPEQEKGRVLGGGFIRIPYARRIIRPMWLLLALTGGGAHSPVTGWRALPVLWPMSAR
jgi:hypothetical protein